jgi:hypothetical protein
MAIVEEIKTDHNNALEIEGIVVNRFQGRANFAAAAGSGTDLMLDYRFWKTRLSPSVKGTRISQFVPRPLGIHMAPGSPTFCRVSCLASRKFMPVWKTDELFINMYIRLSIFV